MTAVVYQGLQSCLDSQIVEARMLRLTFSAPKPQLAPRAYALETTTKELGEKCLQEETNLKSNSLQDQQQQQQQASSCIRDSVGWTFLQVQALYNPSQSPKEEQINKETAYVHPLVKRTSLSKLSEKSLKLCTENLGCETGSDISEESILLLPNKGNSNSPTREQQLEKNCQLLGAGKAKSHNFPPPLTTMRESVGSLQVRPHREDGRLIIEAVKSPSKPSLFQAERCNGRLRLCLVKDSSFSSFDSVASTEETEANIVSSESNFKKEEKETENDLEFEEEEEEEEEAEEAEDDWEDFEEQVDDEGNFESLEEEIADTGMEEFLKPSRCKEVELDNKGLLIWVAIS